MVECDGNTNANKTMAKMSLRMGNAPKSLAWNLFGTTFDAPVTSTEALVQGGLDYNVSKRPLIVGASGMVVGDSIEVTPSNMVTSHMVTMRDDKNVALGVVGKDYGIVQNTQGFKFIDFIEEVSGESCAITSVGALGVGGTTFVCAKMGGTTFVDDAKQDGYEQYVVFTNTHDGTGSLMAFFTNIRVVCQNTLNMAIKGAANKLAFRHTSKVNERIDWDVEQNRLKAMEVFAKSHTFNQEFYDTMRGLNATKVDATDMLKFATRIFVGDALAKKAEDAKWNLEKVEEISTQNRNSITRLLETIDGGIGQEMHRGTKGWLLNGLTSYFHNTKEWKDAESEMKSLHLGGDSQMKVQKGFELLQAM